MFNMINETTTLGTRCPICGKEANITVAMADFVAWQGGKNAQDAFPYLSAEERESLISGICPQCWENMFSESNEDEEDWEDDVDECGYNPYMGCYDFDC